MFGYGSSKRYIMNSILPKNMRSYFDQDPNPDDPNDHDWVPPTTQRSTNQHSFNQCSTNNYNNATNYQSSEWSSDFSPRSSSGSCSEWSGWPSGCTSDC